MQVIVMKKKSEADQGKGKVTRNQKPLKQFQRMQQLLLNKMRKIREIYMSVLNGYTDKKKRVRRNLMRQMSSN